MQKVKIISDSASDISPQIVKDLNITIVPLKVNFGERVYKDFYDLSSDEFFMMMKKTDVMPKTSMVSPSEWKEVFKKESEQYDCVICFTLSSNASGTYQSALLAKEELGSGNVEIIDSNSLSYGYGIAVVEAAKMALNGEEKSEIIKAFTNFMKNIDVYFIVDSLENLRKGGRINLSQAILGTLLDIKPLLTIENGLVVPVAKIRGKKNIVNKMIKIFKERGYAENCKIAIAHGLMPKLKDEMKEKIIEVFKPREISETKVGSVIGTHAGPGVIGVIFVK
jgi:DegV family protein with EDD domain